VLESRVKRTGNMRDLVPKSYFTILKKKWNNNNDDGKRDYDEGLTHERERVCAREQRRKRGEICVLVTGAGGPKNLFTREGKR
jgi:hypothetical protein